MQFSMIGNNIIIIIIILVLLNLTAVLNTVDNILLQKLQCSFGIDATVQSWFESYVIVITPAVHLSGTTPSLFSLVDGVPQGSVLEPLLFVLHMAEICSIIAAHELFHHCYADDTQICFYCHQSECAAQKCKVLSYIDVIADWMAINKLHLNPSMA